MIVPSDQTWRVGATSCAEQFVEDTVGVTEDIEREAKVGPVCGQAVGGGEGDDGNSCVTEPVEVIAHGDHVFLAGQSSEMPVQDEHDWSAARLGGSPRSTIVVDELDIGERVTDDEGHVVGPA